MPRLAAVLLFAAAATAAAQQPAEPLTTLKLETTVIAASAVVRDTHGKPIGGLGKEDFVLTEDGKPADIRYFSQGTELPLTLSLLVDTSGSQYTLIDDEAAASMIFFRSMLTQKQDRAALVQFDNGIVRLQPMTNSVDNLQRALGYLSTPHKSFLPGDRPGTLLFDAIIVTASQVMGAEHGRRAMVLLTDGGDNGSRNTLDKAVAAAQKADIAIYSVYYAQAQIPNHITGGGFNGVGIPTEGQDNLLKLSSATGGKVFYVDREKTLREIFAEIAEDLRLQYELGFRAPDAVQPGSYHKLQLRTTDKKYKVQTRQGFYVPAA